MPRQPDSLQPPDEIPPGLHEVAAKYFRPEDLGEMPDVAAKRASDRAIAAGNPHEAHLVSRAVNEFVNQHGTAPMLVYRRNLSAIQPRQPEGTPAEPPVAPSVETPEPRQPEGQPPWVGTVDPEDKGVFLPPREPQGEDLPPRHPVPPGSGAPWPTIDAGSPPPPEVPPEPPLSPGDGRETDPTATTPGGRPRGGLWQTPGAKAEGAPRGAGDFAPGSQGIPPASPALEPQEPRRPAEQTGQPSLPWLGGPDGPGTRGERADPTGFPRPPGELPGDVTSPPVVGSSGESGGDAGLREAIEELTEEVKKLRQAMERGGKGGNDTGGGTRGRTLWSAEWSAEDEGDSAAASPSVKNTRAGVKVRGLREGREP